MHRCIVRQHVLDSANQRSGFTNSANHKPAFRSCALYVFCSNLFVYCVLSTCRVLDRCTMLLHRTKLYITRSESVILYTYMLSNFDHVLQHVNMCKYDIFTSTVAVQQYFNVYSTTICAHVE